MDMTQTPQQPFMKYYVRFGLVVIAFYVVIGLIRTFVLPGSGGGSGLVGVSFLAPLFSAQFVATAFMKETSRIPTEIDKKRLTNGCMLVFILVQIVLGAVTVFSLLGTNILSDIPSDERGAVVGFMIGLTAVISLVLLGISYLLIRWAFGGLAKKRGAKLGLSQVEDVF